MLPTFKFVEAKVSDLKDPAWIHKTLAGAEVAMGHNVTVMKIDHALKQHRVLVPV
jgi:hypothetical protein